MNIDKYNYVTVFGEDVIGLQRHVPVPTKQKRLPMSKSKLKTPSADPMLFSYHHSILHLQGDRSEVYIYVYYMNIF